MGGESSDGDPGSSSRSAPPLLTNTPCKLSIFKTISVLMIMPNMNYLYKYILEMKIRPEGPGLVPERGQLLLLLRNHVFKLLGVRCRNKVEVFLDMKKHIEPAHRLGRSRPRWSWQGGRRPAGSSAPSSPPGSCETPPRLPPEPGSSDIRHILPNFEYCSNEYWVKPEGEQHSLENCTSLRCTHHR